MSAIAPFVISHTFAAPVATVYRAHSEAEHLGRWMSPPGARVLRSEMDFRVGGRNHYGLEGPDGQQTWGLQRYLEIVPGERIVLLQAFSDADGGLARHPMAPTWPLELHATTTFEALGEAQTRLTISWHPHEADADGIATFDGARAGMAQGFAGTFAALEAYLANLG